MLTCIRELTFLVLGLLIWGEAIFFCMKGLPLFGKEGSRTHVFKILVRALLGPKHQAAHFQYARI